MNYLLIALFVCSKLFAGNCNSKLVNPLTDINWKGIFPIYIMGMKTISGESDKPTHPKGICTCWHPPSAEIPVRHPRFGVPISFWNPTRLVDVTRTPYCMVGLGFSIANSGVQGRGHVTDSQNTGSKESFYHVHWYIYPIVRLLNCLINFGCSEKLPFDAAYITEIDPLWRNDNKSAIINPEAILFGNPIAQLACIADCASATKGLPIDKLFWCSGCQGSLYPFTGTVTSHSGGVQASLLLSGRMAAKLHRQQMAKLKICGDKGVLCEPLGGGASMVIKKSGYRWQMTYPIPSEVKPFGRSEVKWQSGKEYPYKGEDFGYLAFVKRDCCCGANRS